MHMNTTFLRWARLVVGAAAALSFGCSAGLRTVTDRDDLCAVLDSVYARTGLETPINFTGKATVDADQYRVRGVFRLETNRSGDIFFEFTSSMLFGNRIEDFFCSIVADTLRIVDRE